MNLKPFAVTSAVLLASLGAHGQTAPRACGVQPKTEWSVGEKALREDKDSVALDFFRAELKTSASPEARATATAGMLHALINPKTMAEAVKEAAKAQADFPDSVVVLEAVGSVRYRHGEIADAAAVWSTAAKSDPCNARVHYDMSRFLRLNGMFAKGLRELELAHKLAPGDDIFTRALERAKEGPWDYKKEAADLQTKLNTQKVAEEERNKIRRDIGYAEMMSKGGCELVTPVAESTVPMALYQDGFGRDAGAEVEMHINGKRNHFRIDTGAGSLTMNRSAALAAGIVPEAEYEPPVAKGSKPVLVLYGHADRIRVGDMEFKNCVVRFYDRDDYYKQQDGVIGVGIFSKFLVTLNFPQHKMNLGMLPPRPGEKADAAAGKTLSTAAQDDAAPEWRDRYIAPEMQTWTKAFRSGSTFLIPAQVNGSSPRFFALSSGSSYSAVLPEVLGTSTKTTDLAKGGVSFQSMSGQTIEASSAREVDLRFANISEHIDGMVAMDASYLPGNSSVGVSGKIGFDALQHLTISLDYRDNLIHFDSGKRSH